MTKEPAAFNHVTDAAPEYVDVILWHRVALALGGLIIALCGIGYLLFMLMSPTDPVDDSQSMTLVPDQLEAPAAIPETAESAALENQPVAAIPPTTTPVTSTPAATTTLAMVAATDIPAAEDVDTAAILQTEPAAQSLPASTDRRYQIHTEVLVPAVKRALITERMRGREPGTALSDTVELIHKPKFALYQFVEIRGQAGETLIYHWKRNGKTVAKVRIPIGSDKWRNYSSKNFNRSLLGDWQVDVTNSKGMLLVRSKFHLGE